MPIPDFQTIMLPLLQFASDNKEHSSREAIENLAAHFGLTADERQELLPSRTQAIFDNRVGWAKSYLKNALLIEPTKRPNFKITQRGLDALQQNPTKIDIKFLEQYQEFLEFRDPSKKSDNIEVSVAATDDLTPEETLEYSFQKIRQDLSKELLNRIKTCSPSFFERLVVDLLVKMGYGGSIKDAGKAIGKSGDEGIDGIIKEDRLGLDFIYIQAKRWEGVVGRPEIMKFVGALQGQRAMKGVFITTSKFTNEAVDYVSRINSKIVLIDGEQLAQFMVDHDVGVSKVTVYEVKKVDTDYFTDE